MKCKLFSIRNFKGLCQRLYGQNGRSLTFKSLGQKYSCFPCGMWIPVSVSSTKKQVVVILSYFLCWNLIIPLLEFTIHSRIYSSSRSSILFHLDIHVLVCFFKLNNLETCYCGNLKRMEIEAKGNDKEFAKIRTCKF